MTPKLLRLPDVTADTGCGVTKIYDDVGKGLLPAPIKRDRSSFWPADEIGAVVAARIAGKTDEEIRALVAEMVAARPQVLSSFLAARRGIPANEAAA
jgi:prophage regulatory protein